MRIDSNVLVLLTKQFPVTYIGGLRASKVEAHTYELKMARWSLRPSRHTRLETVRTAGKLNPNMMTYERVVSRSIFKSYILLTFNGSVDVDAKLWTCVNHDKLIQDITLMKVDLTTNVERWTWIHRRDWGWHNKHQPSQRRCAVI